MPGIVRVRRRARKQGKFGAVAQLNRYSWFRGFLLQNEPLPPECADGSKDENCVTRLPVIPVAFALSSAEFMLQ